jgi:broad specificity phosphatase PhoE
MHRCDSSRQLPMTKIATPLAVVALVLTAFLLVGSSSAAAQKKLVILVRHAEKVETDDPDPDLSDAGKQRAERLMQRIKKYRPGAVFSTDLKRTRETAAPIAEKRRKQIEIYDPKKPQELIDKVMSSRTKRYVIVGHSNTIPGLANLFLKKELFKSLDESEYGTIWLIRFKNGKVKKTQLLDY